MKSSDCPPGPAETPRLHGDLAIWLLILVEMLTFALLFGTFAVARAREPALFAASQATLDLRFGGINTLLLVSGSAAVALAVQALREARQRRALLGWGLALACAAGFLTLKSIEFSAKFAAGVDLDTNTFYMFYLVLTGFHFLHVLVGAVMIAVLGLRTARGAYGPHDVHAPETGAAFWHMVDLLWIVLFPLVYVMH